MDDHPSGNRWKGLKLGGLGAETVEGGGAEGGEACRRIDLQFGWSGTKDEDGED
jgi:hypothetical protein